MTSNPRGRWISWREPGLVIVPVCLAVGMAVVLSSCGLLQAIFPAPAPEPRPFNHEAHVVRGVSCLDCHEGAEKEVKAGMPTKAFCMNCHEDLDKEKDKPLEKKVAWFLGPDGEPRWSAYGRQKEEIRFSHAAHAGKTACGACHGDMDKNTGLLPQGPQRMSSCIACHQEKAPAKLECSACHTSIDRNRKPENHSQLWSKMHGICARAGGEVATANNCSLCHQQNSCTLCHQTVPPDDHTNYWRLRAHGFAAGLDRSRCATCHTTDSCNACHQETAPISHGAGWNGPRNDHCKSCHVPVQTSGSCSVCHKDPGTHPSSPPKPAWHTAAMNCTACHGASLQHFNPGDNCNICHR